MKDPGQVSRSHATSWTVDEEADGAALAAWLRAQLGDPPWSTVKKWIAAGKVRVDGVTQTDAGTRLSSGTLVELNVEASRVAAGPEVRIVHEDAHVVVIDKPSGMSSVPFEERERGTAMDAIRQAWRRRGLPGSSAPIFVVHRIDKDTSGLLVFARTRRAESALGAAFRAHDIERTYLCVVHGALAPQRIESLLVPDRGDGLRGSSRRPADAVRGKRAVTHVVSARPLRGATQCEVRLETGKTHQVRIHLAESGHPIVGERVYVRDFVRSGGALIDAPRLLLHAATLGFAHPITGEALRFASPLPDDFTDVLCRLGG